MRPLVIANPRSGGGRSPAFLQGVRDVLERRLGPVDVERTEHPGHAIDLAHEATRQGRSLVVALGGDGTLHEVANGVLRAGGGAAVGYVGAGTGGDFRRTLGIEHRLDAYADAIASGRDRALDVGKVRYRTAAGAQGERWFVNVLSVGMGGLVDRHVARAPRVLGGAAAYVWASLRALAECQRGRVRCVLQRDGARAERRITAFLTAICNGRYFGGGMHVAPMARPDDGAFDVVSIDAAGKAALPGVLRRLYAGRHLASRGVEHFACDAIAIDLEDERARSVFLLDVDGEALGGLPVDVQISARALVVRAP